MFFEVARKGDNHFSKYLATIIMVIVAAFIGQIPLLAIFFAKVAQTNPTAEEMEEMTSSLDFSLVGMEVIINRVDAVSLVAAVNGTAVCFYLLRRRSTSCSMYTRHSSSGQLTVSAAVTRPTCCYSSHKSRL